MNLIETYKDSFCKSRSLEQHIVSSGSYEPEENKRIYQKWFAGGARRLFLAAYKNLGFQNGIVCDAGSGFGGNLIQCPKGSYGIEIEKYQCEFACSIGLPTYQKNILDDDLSDLPKVDFVWNSAVLEHIEAPYTFLRKLHQILKPDGTLVIMVPTIPVFPGLSNLPKIGKYFDGFRHGDHINAFTPKTLQFYCERAGFITVKTTNFLNLGPLNSITDQVIGSIVYVGKKADVWEYPFNSTRRVANNLQGFITIGQHFPNNVSAKGFHRDGHNR